MERLTNKKLIKMLLPYMREAKEQEVKMDDVDYYKHPFHEEAKYDEKNRKVIYVRWTQYNDETMIEVYTHLEGKYDLVELSYSPKDETGYGYSKEYRGMGNGFYADVDLNGNITKSEWD